MKKIFLIPLFAIMSLATLQAQVKVNPGIKGGLNISSLSNFEPSSSKTDFYVGGFVAIKFNRFFTLQPEITYSRQGAEVGQYYDGFNYVKYRNQKYDLNYLSFDAVAKYHFNGKGFHVLAGPSLDFKTTDNFPDHEYNPVAFDLGIIGGLGYSLPNGLTFEARFKQGLIDIYGYDGLDYGDSYDSIILNQVFQIGISYTFK